MSITLEQVVPWGRSLWEYTHMFDLAESELRDRRILGVGDGPASFNAEMHERRRHVVSCDPIYVFTAAQIRSRVEAVTPKLIQFARDHRDTFTWRHIESPDHMAQVRLAAMARFLADYEAVGGRGGRYVAGALPALPFAADQFDLALCSHLLFLYSEQLTREFHIASIVEMSRIAREVRVFPLLQLGNTPSPHVEPVRTELARLGFTSEVRRVPYEFQKSGNEMMVVRRL